MLHREGLARAYDPGFRGRIDAACKEAYASAGYESSARNFPGTTLKSDNVFGNDGGIYQLATMTGSVSGGYTAGLNVTV